MESLEESIFNMDITTDQEDYVLLALMEEECRFDPGTWYLPVPLRGWANQPGHPVPVPDLRSQATLADWLDWLAQNHRRVRAAAMELIIMDPA